MIPLTEHGLRAALADALSVLEARTDSLSQDAFSSRSPEHPDWAIGPFARVPEMAFEPVGQSPDPTGIGWTSTSVFNPSVVPDPDGDALVMLYRSSPRKESTSSRIGLARWTAADGWTDHGIVVWPTLDNELLGCEDPKLHRIGDRWVAYYNGIFPIDERDRDRYPSPGYEVVDVGCDINVAVSDDLVHWEKLGPVIDHATSRLWAKGAVLLGDPTGAPVRVDGSYVMYVSEGCNGALTVGRSVDGLAWSFSAVPYLDLEPLGGRLHEVACAVTGHHGDDVVLDFFYSDAAGEFAAAQALYDAGAPFRQRALSRGGSLSWGGLVQHRGRWLIAQGWDAPPGTRRIDVYTSAPIGRPLQGAQ